MQRGLVAPVNRLVTLPEWTWNDPVDCDAPRTLGWTAAAWCEGWPDWPGVPAGWPGLVQPNGPMAGKKFRLSDDQLTFLLWWYALDDDGRWLFHHGIRRLAKGSGKSPFAAVMALLEFLAPVRVDRFDDGVAGRCVGRRVDMPWVQIAATSQSQTANTMRMVRAFAPRRGHVCEFYELDAGMTVYHAPNIGRLEVITSSSASAEGAESSFVVADETEHWHPSNGGVELAATLQDNLAKSGSRLLETSNAWRPGRGTVAERSWDAWVLQEEGRTKSKSKILYDARMAPPDTDMADAKSLRAALEMVYADCWWKAGADGRVDVESIMARIWDPTATPDDSKRKYLNWPAVSEDAWVDPADWARLVDTNRVVADGEGIVMFFDGSKSKDATALIGCCVSDGFVFTIGVWEPAKGSEVDVRAVDLEVRRAFDRWHVRGFFADVREWESFAKVAWPDEFGDRLDIMAVPTGKVQEPIAWDMRSKTYEFTVEAELVAAEIVDGVFSHDGDSRLARHVSNARLAPNRYGVSISKETPDSPKKIDAAICLVGARMIRRRLLSAPAKKSKQAGRAFGFGG